MLKILDKQQVSEIVHLSPTTIWRLEQKGSFPVRIQFAPGRVGWKSSDIEEWINSRPTVDTKRNKNIKKLAELLTAQGCTVQNGKIMSKATNS